MPHREKPFVCIIVPFTRWNSLVAACVRSLLALDYDNYAIALLPDQVNEVPAKYRREPGVTVLETQKSGISYKRNLAIRHFERADFFACIDSENRWEDLMKI